METACVDGHSRLSLSAHTFTFMIKVKVCACVMCVLCAIYDKNISPSLLMIIIKIIILYFIQIRHTDAFPPTGTLLVKYNGLTHTVYASCWQHAYSYIQQIGGKLKTMNAKNTKKSPIHENADASITCHFGDGDISRYRSRFPHTRPVRLSSIIVR